MGLRVGCGCRGSSSKGNVGALIIRIGFWGFLLVIIMSVLCTPNPILIIQAPILAAERSPQAVVAVTSAFIPLWISGLGWLWPTHSSDGCGLFNARVHVIV